MAHGCAVRTNRQIKPVPPSNVISPSRRRHGQAYRHRLRGYNDPCFGSGCISRDEWVLDCHSGGGLEPGNVRMDLRGNWSCKNCVPCRSAFLLRRWKIYLTSREIAYHAVFRRYASSTCKLHAVNRSLGDSSIVIVLANVTTRLWLDAIH